MAAELHRAPEEAGALAVQEEPLVRLVRPEERAALPEPRVRPGERAEQPEQQEPLGRRVR